MDTQGQAKRGNLPSTVKPTTHIAKDEVDVVPVIHTLHHLMTAVTEKEISPATVNAACNCAAQMTSLLRVHLEAERLNLRNK